MKNKKAEIIIVNWNNIIKNYVGVLG